MLEIVPIPAFSDNYIWCIINQNNKRCAVVDPGDAKPVEKFLSDNGLNIVAILITHHHWDHVNGTKALAKLHDLTVYGPAESDIPRLDRPLSHNDTIEINSLDLALTIKTIPGHTLDHIAYIGSGMLFSGDTLFSAGCGRLFEGTAEQMYHSLQTLCALPDETKIYCGHEYTVNNLQFAQTLEPSNSDIKKRLSQCLTLREKNQPTLPSTMKIEKLTNPFLRVNESSVHNTAERHSKQTLAFGIETLAAIRAMKDQW